MKCFIILFLLTFSFNAFSNGAKNMKENNCSEKRKLDITTKFVGEFRVDILNMDFEEFNEYCDENRVIISSLDNNKIILDEHIGSGASYVANFLDGQKFNLDEYVWIEYCPGTSGCQAFGYFFSENKTPLKLKIPEINCDYQNENEIKCSQITKRKEFNVYHPNCSRASFPYDTLLFEFTEGIVEKKIISQPPIPRECSFTDLRRCTPKDYLEFKTPNKGCEFEYAADLNEFCEVCE